MAVFEEKYGDRIEVVTVNVRENPDVARLHRVRYVPTVVFIDENGKILERRVGYMPLEAIESEWAKHGYDLLRKE